MMENTLLAFVASLMFGISCGIAGQELRIYLRDRRTRRILQRMLN